MAISTVEYFLMRTLREQNPLPLGADLLQLGESNWYGDLNLGTFRADVEKFAAAGERADLLSRFDRVRNLPADRQSWELAEIYWRTFLQPSSMTAIDFHGTDKALKLDLNNPIELDRKFNFIMNGGTLEHVFNIAQGFKTIHDHLAPGGFVYHAMPFTGWIEHGFFNVNPTLVWDLAAANGYHVCLLAYCELNPPKIVQLAHREQILKMAAGGAIRPNANLYAVLRGPDQAAPFRIPIQGYYGGQLSAEAVEAWRTLR
jgi:SAM-dependent methyltransferase